MNSAAAARPLSPVEARDALLAALGEMAPIELGLQEASGCVIAAEVQSETDVPEFSLAGVDGFAVRASDIFAVSGGLPATLTIVGRALPGRPPEGTVGWGEAVRVGAGAVLPAGSDCVVRLEDCVVEGESVRILHSVPAGTNVRQAGEDMRAGQTVIPAGRKLGPPELALLAATGRMGALVYPRPRVVVLASGNGLVEPGRPAAMGQTRDATSLTLFAALRELGAIPSMGGIVADDVDALREELLNHLVTADCYIVSGRAAGNMDTLRMAVFKRGDVHPLEAGLDTRPLAYGSFEGKPFFGIPGDVPDVFTTFELFVRPAILKLMGRRDLYRPEVRAELATDLAGLPDRARYARVRVWMEDGRWRAAGMSERASTRLAAMAGSNGLALVPAGRPRRRQGESVQVMVFRPLER
ncbi:MAG: gephyrin-like molybdotransferase Glp [Actinomycetota bacterium]